MNKNRSGKFHRRSPMARRVTLVLNDVRTSSTECVLGNYACKSCPKALHAETGSIAPNSSMTRIIIAWPLLQPHVRETNLTLVDAVDPFEWIAACDNPMRKLCSNLKSVLHDLNANEAEVLRRTILKALRHKPEEFGLRMDCDRWVDVREVGALISRFAATNRRTSIHFAHLSKIPPFPLS